MSPDEEDPAFIALWEHVIKNWEDAAAHQALLESCNEQEILPLAAKRYRLEAASAEEAHGRLAKEQLKKITALAYAQMAASRSGTPQGKKLITAIAAVVSFLLICASALLLSR